MIESHCPGPYDGLNLPQVINVMPRKHAHDALNRSLFRALHAFHIASTDPV